MRSTITAAAVDALIERLAAGDSLRAATRATSLPASRVKGWITRARDTSAPPGQRCQERRLLAAFDVYRRPGLERQPPAPRPAATLICADCGAVTPRARANQVRCQTCRAERRQRPPATLICQDCGAVTPRTGSRQVRCPACRAPAALAGKRAAARRRRQGQPRRRQPPAGDGPAIDADLLPETTSADARLPSAATAPLPPALADALARMDSRGEVTKMRIAARVAALSRR